MELDKRVVCDGVRIDKNIIPAYLRQVQAGTANFELIDVYYSGKGERCQSGNCNHHIRNIFVVRDNSTDTEYHVGCECVRKYGNSLERLALYWKKALEQAKNRKMAVERRRRWAEERNERIAANLQEYADELEFIERYLQYRNSPFMESCRNVIEKGWKFSEKQRETLDRIISETDFEQLEREEELHNQRFEEVLQLFEKLDRVRFGFHPGAHIYPTIRNRFASRGKVSDKELGLLHKWVRRFRRQIESEPN